MRNAFFTQSFLMYSKLFGFIFIRNGAWQRHTKCMVSLFTEEQQAAKKIATESREIDRTRTQSIKETENQVIKIKKK